MEDGSAGGLPVKNDDEFRPFIRRLPEFKFWYWATRAIAIAFVCSWFAVFDVPVFWPVLVMYWLILFFLTSEFYPTLACLGEEISIVNTARSNSEEADSAYDQVPIRTLHLREEELQQEQLVIYTVGWPYKGPGRLGGTLGILSCGKEDQAALAGQTGKEWTA